MDKLWRCSGACPDGHRDGVRQTSRLVGVYRDTVTRLARRAGDHAKALHPDGHRGRFPLKPMRPRWTTSGRSWAKNKSAATRQTRRTTGWAMVGIMWGSTRFIGWCWPWRRVSAPPPTSRLWSHRSSPDGHRDTEARLLNLIATDEYAPYQQAILDAYGNPVTPPRTGKPGRPKAPYKAPPKGLRYATVHKQRRQGRAVKIDYRVVFGDRSQVEQALARSPVSSQINTSFLERQNGTDRHRNPDGHRDKVRKTCRFSKDPDVHEAMTYFSLYSYHFCWPVRTLRVKDPQGRRQQRTPAMAAGFTDHAWSLSQWVRMPAVVQREEDTKG